MKNKNTEQKIVMKKIIRDYKAILFDVDGTLYEQKKLRITMGLHLISFFLLHPGRLKEIRILMEYRSVREHWENISSPVTTSSQPSAGGDNACGDACNLEALQYQYTAQKLHIPYETVENTVKYWMHQYPLQFLPRYQDNILSDFLVTIRKQSIITAAYSDYPAADKLTALGIDADYIFCSSDPNINCMKPDTKAMYTILETLQLAPQEVLMIGDRYSKDGLAAKNVGMDFIILPKSIPARHKLYDSFHF